MKIEIKKNIQFVPSCNLLLIDEKEYILTRYASTMLEMLIELNNVDEFKIMTKESFSERINTEKNISVIASNAVKLIKMLLYIHGIDIITHHKVGYRLKIK